MNRPTIKSLDLFCGIGGLTLGLQKAGLSCVGGIDIWEDAGATFAHNHPDLRFARADLTTVNASELLKALAIAKDDVEVIVGGPPCQGFSTVGKRDNADPRNRLWTHYLELVHAIRPAYVVIENVEGMNVMAGGAVRDGIIQAFADVGYRMKADVIRSADFGVPQLRKRIVFMGWLPDVSEPGFPAPTHGPGKYITVRDAIFDLPQLESGQKATQYVMSPFTDFQRAMRGRVRTLSNHEAANHPPHLIEILWHIALR